MEIKITVTVEGIEPIEVKVDIPEKGKLSNHPTVTNDFDYECRGWSKNHSLNEAFFETQEEYLNVKLKSYGYVTLNEAYDALGMVRTKEGQVLGWWYDPNKPDKRIKIGIEHMLPGRNLDDPKYKLSFNVDGNIMEFI